MIFSDIVRDVDDYVAQNGPLFAADYVQSRFKFIYENDLYIQRFNEIVHDLGHVLLAEDSAVVGTNSVILHQSAVAYWAITRLEFLPNMLGLTPAHSVHVKLDKAQVGVTEYELSGFAENGIFDPSKRLKEVSRSVWNQGEVRTIDRWTRTHAIDQIPANSPLFLSLNSAFIYDYEWIFDRVTLLAQRHVCIRPGSANLRTIFELLAAVGSAESIDFLEPYTLHSLHFIRWEAITTIAAIDKTQGLKLIQNACQDEHPEIRRAAELTLASTFIQEVG